MKGNADSFVKKMREVFTPFEHLSYDELVKQLKLRVPSKMYHYRGSSGINDERNLRDMLVNSQFYLRRPSDFNDPFECRFQFGKLADTVQLFDYLVKTAIEQGHDVSVSEGIATGMLASGRDGMEKVAKQSTIDRFQLLGIFCFAENYRNMLMWSHYGESHKGVCVEFNVKLGLRTLGLCRKVDYGGVMPTLDYPELDGKELLLPLFGKSEPWSYEQEWRLVIPSGAHQHIDFPPQAVTSVIYGCAVTDVTKDLVSKLLEERKLAGLPAVSVKTLARSESEYKLVDVP